MDGVDATSADGTRMPTDKDTKEHAEYRMGHDDDRCYHCTMFVPAKRNVKTMWVSSTCTAVEGEISPHGLCNYFERDWSIQLF